MNRFIEPSDAMSCLALAQIELPPEFLKPSE